MSEPSAVQQHRRLAWEASHPRVLGLWVTVLVLASLETVIAVVERWPAQFGGAGDPSQIDTQWMSRGTALSPPLFILVGLALAVVLLLVSRRPAAARVSGVMAAAVGLIGTVGSLGELLAPASADVPRLVADAAVIGVVACLLLVGTGVAVIVNPRGGPGPRR